MPRVGRGGPRQGAPGQSYPNRSDLNTPKPTMQVPTGQPYGQAGQQEAAMHALPMAPPPGPPQAPPAPGGPPGVPPGAQGPPPAPLPGELGDFGGPSQRPDEHLMTGSPSGPGPGPEVLSMNQRGGFLADRLDQMAKVSGNTDLQILANRARSLGQ